MNHLTLRRIAGDIILVSKKNGNRLAQLICTRLGNEKVPAARGECMRLMVAVSEACDATTRGIIADGMLKCFEAADEIEINKSCALEYLVTAGDRRTLPIIYKMLEGDEKAQLFAMSRLPLLRDSACASQVAPLFIANYENGSKPVALAALMCLAEDKNQNAVAPLLAVLKKDYKLAICSKELVAVLDVLQPKIGTQTYQGILAADAAEARRQQELAAAQAKAEQEAQARVELERQEAEKKKRDEIASARKAATDWMRSDTKGFYESFCRRFSHRVAMEIFKADFKNSFPALKRTPDDVLNPLLATLTVAFNNDFQYDGRSGGQVYFKFKQNSGQDGWEIAEAKLNDENGLAVATGSAIQTICAEVCLDVGREYRDRSKA